MVKKTKLIGSPYLVKLLKIYQEDLSLHYIYENVPFSLSSFLERQLSSGSQQILEMSKKLFLKKITYELAILIAYLVDMRIEIDLSV